MFDAHCHLDMCEEDPQALLVRARHTGVTDLMIAGVEAKNWPVQNALAGPGVHVAWGVHPWRVAQAPMDWRAELTHLAELLENPPIVPRALGETGLDYSKRFDERSRERQREAFRLQIRLAKSHALPLILHVVRAHHDAIQILKEEGVPDAGGLVHSFSGNDIQARNYINLNLYISFSGSVTNPRSTRIRAAATAVPDEWLLVESDAPDQTPFNRKPSPNEPAFLIDVIAALAELRGCTTSHLATTTATNAHTLFCTRS